MIDSIDQVKLSAALALALSDDPNDSVVLIDELVATGNIVIEIPSQSLMKAITGEEFFNTFSRALHFWSHNV